MSRALFIDENFVKSNTPIDENVDQKLINPVIFLVQKKYVEKTLGTNLYNDICTEIIADYTLATVPNYLTLVNEYVADMMLYWILYEAQVPLTYKFRNKSVSKNTDPNSQPVGFEEHKYLKDDFKKDAQYFTERLELYLCANESLFPLYCTENEVDELSPRDTPPQVAVYLGQPRNRRYDENGNCIY